MSNADGFKAEAASGSSLSGQEEAESKTTPAAQQSQRPLHSSLPSAGATALTLVGIQMATFDPAPIHLHGLAEPREGYGIRA